MFKVNFETFQGKEKEASQDLTLNVTGQPKIFLLHVNTSYQNLKLIFPYKKNFERNKFCQKIH